MGKVHKRQFCALRKSARKAFERQYTKQSRLGLEVAEGERRPGALGQGWIGGQRISSPWNWGDGGQQCWGGVSIRLLWQDLGGQHKAPADTWTCGFVIRIYQNLPGIVGICRDWLGWVGIGWHGLCRDLNSGGGVPATSFGKI